MGLAGDVEEPLHSEALGPAGDAEEYETPHFEALDFAGDVEEFETPYFEALDLAGDAEESQHFEALDLAGDAEEFGTPRPALLRRRRGARDPTVRCPGPRRRR